jgi:hypothetical protein
VSWQGRSALEHAQGQTGTARLLERALP